MREGGAQRQRGGGPHRRRGSDSTSGGHSFDEHGMASLLFFWSLPGHPPQQPPAAQPSPPWPGPALGSGDRGQVQQRGESGWGSILGEAALHDGAVVGKLPDPDPRAQRRGPSKNGPQTQSRQRGWAGPSQWQPAGPLLVWRLPPVPGGSSLRCNFDARPIQGSPEHTPWLLLLAGNGHPR